MKRKLNVLIVEDHNLVIEAYKIILNEISNENQHLNFRIETANNCEIARKKITSGYLNRNLDLALLDLSLPPTEDKRILSGVDLGILIKQKFKNSKIIILTFYNDNFRLNNILKNVNPDGLMVKNDVSMESLKKSVLKVLENLPYYSETVLNMIRMQVNTEIIIDKIDRQLLFELSRGVKMKDLTNFLPLSISGIERRKRKLKKAFNVLKENDAILIEVARSKGFI